MPLTEHEVVRFTWFTASIEFVLMAQQLSKPIVKL